LIERKSQVIQILKRLYVQYVLIVVALEDILSAFTTPDNDIELRSAREKAGNDMLKTMQFVFPVTTQIQMNVIQKYGFPSDGEGMHFSL